MPNRILRDWTDSEPVNALSVHAERLFVRLIMKADDYGRYTANPKLLRAMLFPLTFEQVREADMSRWLAECEAAGLIVLYGTEAKPLLEIINFNQRTRSPSKFASPNSVDGQMSASGGHLLAYSETHSEANAKADAETGGVRERFEEFIKTYPKKAGHEEAWGEYRRLNPDDGLHRRILAAVAERAKAEDWQREHGRFVPRAADWLRDRRWEEVRLPGGPAKPKPPSRAVVEDRLKRKVPVPADVLELYPDLAAKYGGAA